MRNFFVFTFLFLCVCCPAFSAQGNDAVGIINHLYITSGQMPVNDIVIEYEEMTSDGSSSSMALSSKDKIYFKQPTKIRVDSIMVEPGGVNDGKNLIIIRDGLNAWLYLSTGQYPVKKKVDEPSPPLNLPFGLTHYNQDIDNVYKIEGKETVDGVSTTKISIDGSNGKSVVWVDTSRWVPLKLTVTRKIKDKENTKMVLYKEFGQTKDGRYFPMKLEKYNNGTMTALVIYKALVVNTGLDDNLFNPMEKFLK